MASLAAFEVAIERLVGRRIWSATAGAGTGTALELSIGNKVPRPRPLTNPLLTEDERRFDSEFALYITCAWRLQNDEAVLTGSLDDNTDLGAMTRSLSALVGRRIDSIALRPPGLDLSVSLDNSWRLEVFADQMNTEEALDNWVYFSGELIWVVGPRGTVQSEQRGLRAGPRSLRDQADTEPAR